MQILNNLILEYNFMLKKLFLLILNKKNLNQLDSQFWIQKILLEKKFMNKGI